MIDWSEGQLKLNSLVKNLYAKLLERDPEAAKEICNEIIAEARLVRAKITVEQTEE
jgi:hypothetical protein